MCALRSLNVDNTASLGTLHIGYTLPAVLLRSTQHRTLWYMTHLLAHIRQIHVAALCLPLDLVGLHKREQVYRTCIISKRMCHRFRSFAAQVEVSGLGRLECNAHNADTISDPGYSSSIIETVMSQQAS